jgi:hypothetical protein
VAGESSREDPSGQFRCARALSVLSSAGGGQGPGRGGAGTRRSHTLTRAQSRFGGDSRVRAARQPCVFRGFKEPRKNGRPRQRIRERLELDRRRPDNDAPVAGHPGAAPEEDRVPAAAQQGPQGRARDVQVEGQGAAGGEPQPPPGLRHHRE